MKQEVYKRILFEPGDVIDSTRVVTGYSVKRRLIEKCARAVVLKTQHRKNNGVSYVVFSDAGDVFNINEAESACCEHIGQIDMSLLCEKEDEE